MSSAMITLICKNGQSLRVKRASIMMSKLVRDMLEECDKVHPVIEFPIIGLDVMKKVVAYCDHHHNRHARVLPKPLTGDIETLVSDFDAAYLVMSREYLFHLIHIALYLDIRDLQHLCCAKIASSIGKIPLEKLSSLLGIDVKGYTEDMEEKWCIE